MNPLPKGNAALAGSRSVSGVPDPIFTTGGEQPLHGNSMPKGQPHVVAGNFRHIDVGLWGMVDRTDDTGSRVVT